MSIHLLFRMKDVEKIKKKKIKKTEILPGLPLPKGERVSSGLSSLHQQGHMKKGIDLAIPGLVVQHVIHYTTSTPHLRQEEFINIGFDF